MYLLPLVCYILVVLITHPPHDDLASRFSPKQRGQIQRKWFASQRARRDLSTDRGIAKACTHLRAVEKISLKKHPSRGCVHKRGAAMCRLVVALQLSVALLIRRAIRTNKATTASTSAREHSPGQVLEETQLRKYISTAEGQRTGQAGLRQAKQTLGLREPVLKSRLHTP